MQEIGIKVDTVSTLPANPFNQNLRKELQAWLTAAGYTLDSEGDVTNLGDGDFARGILLLARCASFVYDDTSTVVNSFTLTEKTNLLPGSLDYRSRSFYKDGLTVCFKATEFDNTGACTLRLVGYETGTTQPFTYPDGTNLIAGAITKGYYYLVRWNLGNTRWELIESFHPKMTFKHISGLVPENDPDDLAHDITISPGEARANSLDYSSFYGTMQLNTPITKQLDAAWAEGNDSGGLWNATIAADTWYHMALIRKNTGLVDAMFYPSGLTNAPAPPSLPTNYTAYRRIGSVLTDASSNIVLFRAFNTAGGAVNISYYGPFIIPETTPTTIRQVVSLPTPPDLELLAEIKAHLQQSGDASVSIIPLYANDFVPSASTGLTLSDINSDIWTWIRTNTNSEIAIRSTAATLSEFYIYVWGFKDERLD